MADRPRLLILSFSVLARDARLLKQIRAFASSYRVTTCGFGPSPHPDVTHLEVPQSAPPTGPAARWEDGLILLGASRWVYRHTAYVRAARRLLQGRQFDVILANDANAVPLAVELFGGSRVHADLHEHWPSLHAENPRWRLVRGRFYRVLTRRYVTRSASATTVGAGIAREYTREFGMPVGVVTNATPYADLVPTDVHRPLRIVHSGGGQRNRALETTIAAVQASTAPVRLDLYLVPIDSEYVAELREMAARTPERVTVHDPVPYSELIGVLSRADVGVFVLPPVSFSYRWTLPNKLFDYVQARLGVIVGPSPEMSDYVRRYGLGEVTDDFTAESLTRLLDTLTAADVTRWKAASHAHAHELSSESQVQIWRDAVDTLAGRRHG